MHKNGFYTPKTGEKYRDKIMFMYINQYNFNKQNFCLLTPFTISWLVKGEKYDLIKSPVYTLMSAHVCILGGGQVDC